MRCRLVCKRWSAGVDNFIRNQPSISGYDSNRVPHSALFDDDRLELTRLFGVSIDFRKECESKTGLTRRLGTDSLTGKNPFLGGVLKINSESPQCPNPNYSHMNKLKKSTELVWKQTLELVQKNGRRVSSLWFRFEDTSHSSWKRLLSILENLPNLNFLELSFKVDYGYDEDKEDTSEHLNFPLLPNLETIFFSPQPESQIFKEMIMFYGPQLNRIQIQIGNVHPNLFQSLENLTSLELHGIQFPVECDKTALIDLLTKLKCPGKLKRLSLYFGDISKPGPGAKLEISVIQLVHLFPNLETLDLDIEFAETNVELVDSLDSGVDIIPELKLKYLRIPKLKGFDYNFLLGLLTIKVLAFGIGYESSRSLFYCERDSLVKIRKELETGKLYESNVWQILTNLKEIRIKPEFFHRKEVTFCREVYEHFRRKHVL